MQEKNPQKWGYGSVESVFMTIVALPLHPPTSSPLTDLLREADDLIHHQWAVLKARPSMVVPVDGDVERRSEGLSGKGACRASGSAQIDRRASDSPRRSVGRTERVGQEGVARTGLTRPHEG